MNRFLLGCCLFTALVAANAQTLPPAIKILHPFAVGGGVDGVARLTADALQKATGSTVIVEARPGAGGVIATQVVTEAKPDGGTLLINGPARGTTPYLFSRVTFESLKDIVAVAPILQSPNVLVVGANSPILDLQGLIKAAKAAARPLTYGTAGIASPTHLPLEFMNGTGGVQWLHVPYKGSSAAVIDVVGGQIDFAALSYSSTVSLVKSGKLRVIAALQPKRSNLLPNVPAIAEAGFDKVNSISPYVLYARAGTPQPVLDKLAAGVRGVYGGPESVKALAELGYEPWLATPAAVDEMTFREYEMWGPVIKRLGITPN